MSDSRRGDNEPEEYVFDYMMDDWSMRKPSGVEERKERMIADERAATLIKDVRGPGGSRLSRRESNYKWESWGFAMTNRIEGFGGANALRTVTAYYPVAEGDIRSGRVRSVRHEDGRMELYDYALEGGLWSIIETHAHEQAPEPVDGKTTHEVTVANSRGQILDVNCKLDESPLDFLGTVPVLAHLYSLRLPHLQSIPFLVRICR